jgi:DNA replication protein DnaC
LAQAVGQAAIQQGYKVIYRETHILLEQLADACLDGSRKQFMEMISTVPLLIIDDFGMRKLPSSAAEDLLEIVMRRYERCSTLLTSNRPVESEGKTCRRRLRRSINESVLPIARWPVLRRPSLAGFQVAPEAPTACGAWRRSR